MKQSKTITVRYRRKREGRTDYKKRLKLIVSNKARLVVRKSLYRITAQIVTYADKGDIIIATARSDDLKKFGWNGNFGNLPSAYLVGLLIARRAKEKGMKEAILDIGLNKSIPGSKLFAVLKGALDNGLQIPHSDSVLPEEGRLTGKHIEAYAKKLKETPEVFEKRFSKYIKDNFDPLHISTLCNEVKNKIVGE